MTPQVWIPLALQGLVPPVWMAWIALGPRQSLAGWASHVLALGLLLSATGLAGLWLALPRGLLWIWVGGWACATLVGWMRARGRWPTRKRAWAGLAARAALGLVLAFGTVQAIRGWIPLQEPRVLHLALPVAGGTFLVANGGSTPTVNAHLHTLEPPRFRAWRGQSYAVDLVAVGAWGSRERGLHPSDPAAYAAFGAPILAPCTGTVIRAVDRLPDLPVPLKDREHLAGNHVIIACGGDWIVLGHLQSGSVRVAEGQRVDVGEVVGRLGNSGNTDEPHLHVHAQTPGSEDEPLAGTPLPILIDGRWLVRNQRLTAPHLPHPIPRPVQRPPGDVPRPPASTGAVP